MLLVVATSRVCPVVVVRRRACETVRRTERVREREGERERDRKVAETAERRELIRFGGSTRIGSLFREVIRVAYTSYIYFYTLHARV